ncbi:hypothetical protein EYF80_000100 [Liparis tanakae]|uniref:Uncharacterized protein n=1 Tax=Liparis tanakae TaxID=230148 RepID=A0A4Z2JHQ6_9TELE|nr:hypothetical protein EYF80_000100 [Liparis tanakae]
MIGVNNQKRNGLWGTDWEPFSSLNNPRAHFNLSKSGVHAPQAWEWDGMGRCWTGMGETQEDTLHSPTQDLQPVGPDREGIEGLTKKMTGEGRKSPVEGMSEGEAGRR